MSTEHDGVPLDPSSGVVRAQLHIAGLFLRRTADGRGTSATYVISSDPQGSIPSFIVRKARATRHRPPLAALAWGR